MNVVHVGKYYHPYQRGIETYLRLLCERLNREVNLDVLVAHDHWRTVHETVNGVRVTRLGRVAEICATSFCLGLAPALRRLRPDIVHVHLPNPWAEASYFLAGCPGRLVVSFHSDIIRQRWLLKLHAPLHRRFLARASRIIVATPEHIRHSPFLARLPRERCTVVHYGIETERFALDAAMRTRVNALQAAIGAPRVLFVGRLVYYKGLDVLLRAAVDVPAQIMIVGAGPLEQRLRTLAAELGIGARVHLLGEVDAATLVAAYHACDVFCLPSTARSEAFGIVQLEAFAAGKPVVSTQLPSGVPYVNQHGRTGLVVPPGDAQELARALNTLLKDEALRATLGAQARERVEQEFNADRMAAETLRVYNEVLTTG